jgi:hypothetical protein
LQGPLVARGILWRDGEYVARTTLRNPDRQIGIEQAFTGRRNEIQWVDFAHRRFLRTF